MLLKADTSLISMFSTPTKHLIFLIQRTTTLWTINFPAACINASAFNKKHLKTTAS